MNKKNINQETSQIAWRELQRFFAQGLAIFVSSEIDLVDAAYQFSTDNKPLVEQWLTEAIVAPVSDQQAKVWYEKNTQVWAVVIKPWILIQETIDE